MSDIYNSKLAKFLGNFHDNYYYAITTSKDCTRYSCEEHQVNLQWRNHENTHKDQYKKLGWCNFIIQYLWESIVHGYENNKFEVEARKVAGED